MGPDRADAVSLSVAPLLSLVLHGSTHLPKEREVQMLTETLLWIQAPSIWIRTGFSVLSKNNPTERERMTDCTAELDFNQKGYNRFTVYLSVHLADKQFS